VTAYSTEDAIFLLEGEGYLISETREVVEDIDVSQLDERHILRNIGPTYFRGVWYPCLNIGWRIPGAHHPKRGGRVKPEIPFVCRIQVGQPTDK
jgi:hypothetical protein